MTPTPVWREITVGFALPDRAFGAAVDVDGLLDEPELHFAATVSTSRLILMPRSGTFTRLVLEWETLPEIGVFTTGSLGAAALDEADSARVETWMRDIASLLHASRDSIRATAERAVLDASSGRDVSLPVASAPGAHLVSARIGTRVAAPSTDDPIGIVDVVSRGADGSPAQDPAASPGSATNDTFRDEMLFVVRATGRVVGRRITHRRADEAVAVELVAADDNVSEDQLAAWYDQHIDREVLFDDVWQVCAHLVAGLEAPASVAYFS